MSGFLKDGVNFRLIYRNLLMLILAHDIMKQNQEVVIMPTITPISDLRNYGNVLDKVSEGSPVYLTRNGRGVYSIRDMHDEENFEKAEAMIRLLCELNAGIRSAEEEGWISEEDFRAHIHKRRDERSEV